MSKYSGFYINPPKVSFGTLNPGPRFPVLVVFVALTRRGTDILVPNSQRAGNLFGPCPS